MVSPDELLIGSYSPMASPYYFLGTVRFALSNGENTFMFYTGAPQNDIRTPLDKVKIEEGIALAKKGGIHLDKIVVHAPYIINLANSREEGKFIYSEKVLLNELKRSEVFGVKFIVLHPGLDVGMGKEAGLNTLVEGLDYVLAKDEGKITICLETMAGKGTEVGSSFEELAYVISHVKDHSHLGVCLDTCHINDAGYDVSDIDGTLERFEMTIGLNRLKVIHLNDSRNVRGSHRDRHENLGFGTIGFEVLMKRVYSERLKEIPKILETPFIDGYPPYGLEIASLKAKKMLQEYIDRKKDTIKERISLV
jgi:deoxyribonuclease-4